MKVAVKSVQVVAIESGIPDSLVERHIDALCEMVLRIRQQERKRCQNNIRKWYFNRALNKPQLFEVLEDS